METAKNRVGELTQAQTELQEYSKSQLGNLNDAVEKIISLVRTEQENIKTKFESAIAIEEKRLADEIEKYTKTKEELKAKSVDLGNMIEALGIFIEQSFS